MNWKGFKDIQATIIINLNKSEKDLWENLDKDAKWGINKATKSGLAIQIIDDEQNWNKFYEIYTDTCKYGGIIPLNKTEIKKGKLFGCFLKDELIAGAVVKIYETKTELFLNASLHEFLKYQPNNLLYWFIIKWSKENNFDSFDLGGYQLNSKKGDKLYNINKFKERWGGEKKIFYIYSKNPFYILGRKLIRNFRFFWWLNNKIKGRTQ